MKTASDELIDHLDLSLTTLTMCVKLVLTKYQPQIVNIMNTDPCIIQTIWAHGYEDGDVVKIVDARGLTELNKREFSILKLDDYFFQINEDATGYGKYLSHGEVRKVVGYTSFPFDLVVNV